MGRPFWIKDRTATGPIHLMNQLPCIKMLTRHDSILVALVGNPETCRSRHGQQILNALLLNGITNAEQFTGNPPYSNWSYSSG